MNIQQHSKMNSEEKGRSENDIKEGGWFHGQNLLNDHSMEIIQRICTSQDKNLHFCIYQACSSCLNELMNSYLGMIQRIFKLLLCIRLVFCLFLHSYFLIQIIFFLTLTKKNGLDFSWQSSEYPQIRDLEKWTCFFKNGKESV